MHQVMMMMTKVVQVVHRLMASWRCWVVPVVWMVLWMVQQVMVMVMTDEHGGSL
jgi:hypothetical protein